MKISEVLTAEQVEANHKTLLLAGVGSGKNYFVENCLHNVYLTTSRKIKQQETEMAVEHDWGRCTTFSTTANWIMYYGKKNAAQYINKTFDFFVVDEAHCLITDETYTNNGYYIVSMLRYIEIPILLMTATPQPLYFSKLFEDYTVIDLRNKCDNVLPENVYLINKRQVPAKMRGAMKYGNLFAYLVDNKKACISMARKYDGEFINAENKKQTQAVQAMLSGEAIKQNIFCTSVLREGVNIKANSRKIKTGFAEVESMLTAYQFAGRFRYGLRDFFIVLPNREEKYTLPMKDIDMIERSKQYTNKDLVSEEIKDWLCKTNKYLLPHPTRNIVYFNFLKEIAVKYDVVHRNKMIDNPNEELEDYFKGSTLFKISSDRKAFLYNENEVHKIFRIDQYVSDDEIEDFLKLIKKNKIISSNGKPYSDINSYLKYYNLRIVKNLVKTVVSK